MRATGFFAGMNQAEVPWRDRTICSPLFYYDLRAINVQFLAPLRAVTALLPSRRLYPLRATPWHSVIAISAFEHRNTDIGPYNELGISVPVSLSGPTRLFTGSLWPAPAEPDVYIVHLPVTTEIARDAGIEFGGYPKFLAGIEFSQTGDWVTCRVSEGAKHILTLSVQPGSFRPASRLREHFVNVRNGRLVRSLMINDEHEESSSNDPKHVRLEIGDHPIGRQLKELPLGRAVAFQYIPQVRAILTDNLETFDI
jgi:hypothetical protein